MLENNTKSRLRDILRPSLGNEELDDKIDLFEKLLTLASSCDELNDLGNKVFKALNEHLYELEYLTYNEQIFKLILFITDRDSYDEVIKNHRGLASLYKRLDVMSKEDLNLLLGGSDEDDEYRSTTYQEALNVEETIKAIEDKFATNQILLPYVRGYLFRNYTAHICKEFDFPTQSKYYLSILTTTIETAWKKKKEILNAFVSENVSFKEYIDKIIKTYENQRTFTYIPSNVTPWQNTVDSNVNLSSGNIIDIIKNNPSLNKIKLIGHAGSGKTTTLKYLEYKDAFNCRNNNYKKEIPVLINLIDITDKDADGNFIVDQITKKVGIADSQVIEHLILGKRFKIYIDGINEIKVSNINFVLNSIEMFVRETKLKVIISDRDNDEFSCLNDIPTFILERMNEKDIEKFIEGNSKDPKNTSEKINLATQNNPALKNEISHPYMLKGLITIIEYNKEIPSNAVELTGLLLETLVDRERIEKHDQNARYIHRLLTYLCIDVMDPKKMDIFYIIKRFNMCIEELKLNINSDDMLTLIVKMGILQKVNLEQYEFTNADYATYYITKAIELDYDI